MTKYDIALAKIREITNRTQESNDFKLGEVCKILKNTFKTYDWVGYYFADHDTQILHLGPFAGAETEHIAIPFGEGICGQVAVTNQNFVVPDVAAQDNYIACSINVKSEIVIPLFVNGKNIGQLDIDSHTPDAFSSIDEDFLMAVNKLVAKLY